MGFKNRRTNRRFNCIFPVPFKKGNVVFRLFDGSLSFTDSTGTPLGIAVEDSKKVNIESEHYTDERGFKHVDYRIEYHVTLVVYDE